jgi:CBS-domain-containing membrane protein
VAESKGPDAPVGPLSSNDLVGVNADDDAAVAVWLMREHAVRRLPVIDDGQIAGVVSLGDLAAEDDSASARRVWLPVSRESLAELLSASGEPARLAAALVRVSLSQRAASEVTAAVPD